MRRRLGALAVTCAAACVLAPAGLATDSPTARIAFVKSSRSASVWVAGAGGGHQRRLGPGSDALISPDGRLIAASGVSDEGPRLTVYRAVGGTLGSFAQVTQPVIPVAFSPDSRYLAIARQDTKSGLGQGDARLDVIDLGSGQVTASVPGLVAGASFAPSGPTRLVFGLSHSQRASAAVNLYELRLGTHSAAIARLTTDDRSLLPVWGARGIVFDQARRRGRDKAPAYTLALLRGHSTKRIASPRPGPLVSGLSPVAISSDGRHLVADYSGADTSQAYAVDLAANRYYQLRTGAQAWGISRDGRRVLISYGGFEGRSRHATIATEPFAGGRARPLIHGGDDPTWNR